jgi:hypothetical protein
MFRQMQRRTNKTKQNKKQQKKAKTKKKKQKQKQNKTEKKTKQTNKLRKKQNINREVVRRNEACIGRGPVRSFHELQLHHWEILQNQNKSTRQRKNISQI